MVVGQNKAALDAGRHLPRHASNLPDGHPDKRQSRTACCGQLKNDALSGDAARHVAAHAPEPARPASTSSIRQRAVHTASSSARAPTRRAAAPRSATSRRATRTTTGTWAISRPSSGTSSRPTSRPARTCASTRCSTGPSCNIWEYIKREKIPTVSLYYDQGDGTRYRSLGCGPCQAPIQSTSKNVDDIIAELRSGKLKNIAERSGPPAGRQARPRRAAPRRVHVMSRDRQRTFAAA